nr:unnamed protein product [Digitaria exilis]
MVTGGAPSASASTPASESTVADGLDLQADDATPSSQPATSLMEILIYSFSVCEKVESKGRTTYNEVADELVAEFSDPNINIDSPNPDNPSAQQYDEKNIRRRVYDALNVLMAVGIISKDKKEIQWIGLPKTSMNDIEELKTEAVALKGRIDKKSAYLQDLQDQYASLQNVVQRNQQLYGAGDPPYGRVALPFTLVKTRPRATVEVEISDDMQLVHFNYKRSNIQFLELIFEVKDI